MLDISGMIGFSLNKWWVILFPIFLVHESYAQEISYGKLVEGIENQLDRRACDSIKSLINLMSLHPEVDSANLGFYLRKLGFCYQDAGELDLALECYHNSFVVLERVSFSETYYIYLDIADVLQAQSNQIEAARFYEKYQKSLPNNASPDQQYMLYMKLGANQIALRNFDEAIRNNQIALDFALKIEDDSKANKVWTVYNNMAIVETELGNHKNALQQYIRQRSFALELEKKGKLMPIIQTNMNLGVVYLRLGNNDSAFICCSYAHEKARNTGDNNLIVKTKTALADACDAIGNEAKAMHYYHNSLKLSKEHALINPLEVVLTQLEKFHEKRDRCDSAYYYLKLRDRHENEVNVGENDHVLFKLRERFDAAKREEVILRQEIEANKKDKLLLVIGLFSLILILGVAALIFGILAIKQRNKKLKAEASSKQNLLKLNELELKEQKRELDDNIERVLELESDIETKTAQMLAVESKVLFLEKEDIQKEEVIEYLHENQAQLIVLKEVDEANLEVANTTIGDILDKDWTYLKTLDKFMKGLKKESISHSRTFNHDPASLEAIVKLPRSLSVSRFRELLQEDNSLTHIEVLTPFFIDRYKRDFEILVKIGDPVKKYERNSDGRRGLVRDFESSIIGRYAMDAIQGSARATLTEDDKFYCLMTLLGFGVNDIHPWGLQPDAKNYVNRKLVKKFRFNTSLKSFLKSDNRGEAVKLLRHFLRVLPKK